MASVSASKGESSSESEGSGRPAIAASTSSANLRSASGSPFVLIKQQSRGAHSMFHRIAPALALAGYRLHASQQCIAPVGLKPPLRDGHTLVCSITLDQVLVFVLASPITVVRWFGSERLPDFLSVTHLIARSGTV